MRQEQSKNADAKLIVVKLHIRINCTTLMCISQSLKAVDLELKPSGSGWIGTTADRASISKRGHSFEKIATVPTAASAIPIISSSIE